MCPPFPAHIATTQLYFAGWCLELLGQFIAVLYVNNGTLTPLCEGLFPPALHLHSVFYKKKKTECLIVQWINKSPAFYFRHFFSLCSYKNITA